MEETTLKPANAVIRIPKEYPINYLIMRRKDSTHIRVNLYRFITGFNFKVTDKGLEFSVFFDEEQLEPAEGAIAIEYFINTSIHIPIEWPGGITPTKTCKLNRTCDGDAQVIVYH